MKPRARSRRTPAAPQEPEALAHALFADAHLDTPAAIETHPTRRKILDAALEVFAELGFRGATTRVIAERAGVAEKTLFAHYRSKAEIFSAAMAPALDAFLGPTALQGIAAALGKAPTLRDRMLAIARNRVEFAGRNIHLVKALVQEVMLDPEFRARMRERFTAKLLPIATVALGTGTSAPPERVIRMFLSLVVGYIVTRWILVPDRAWDDEAELRAMVDTLLRGLAAPA
jgi:AcrR family transcriptional regulator